MKKVYPDATAALAGLLRDGMTIMAGGFGLCGIPDVLIDAVRERVVGAGIEEACAELGLRSSSHGAIFSRNNPYV